MSIQFQPLTGREKERTHQRILTAYLDGACYIFAIALHRALGWPIVGLMVNEVIRHALLQPEGAVSYFDARGWVSGSEIGTPFNIQEPVLRKIKEEDLLRLPKLTENELLEFNLASATEIAELAWPELCWPENSFLNRAKKFAEELEELSRKHKIWLHTPYETAKPILRDDCDKESGYNLDALEVGGYTINRRLRLGGD
ncbi:MAG TPA: hypothetical protein VFA52_00565 [Candidatus Paceibacterota bacterium]|nr:hypothetical protein [Candidatus Paceibacterota bacterium]